MARLAEPEALLPLSEAVFQILLALADRPRHGYAIMQEIETRTEGGVRMGPGTLYGAIKRLRAQALVEEIEAAADAEGETGGDERRRYYRLTARGLEVARLEMARLERLLASARSKRLARRPA